MLMCVGSPGSRQVSLKGRICGVSGRSCVDNALCK
jgi:hypothetical protein